MLATSHTASASAQTPADQPRAVVGPNAVIQLSAALRAQLGPAIEQQIFATAALSRYLQAPPTQLVPEHEAARLFAATKQSLPNPVADAILTRAGSLTADYIIANRIPRQAQQLLRTVPHWLAVRLLLSAIKAHAWTFAGSGSVIVAIGRYPSMTIANNPLATPGCPWHVAVLQRLFARLAAPTAHVTHTREGSTDHFQIAA